LWTICRELHVLPNDPNFKTLNSAQVSWILENIITDKKEQDAFIKGRSGTSSSTIEVEAAEFDELIKSKRESRRP